MKWFDFTIDLAKEDVVEAIWGYKLDKKTTQKLKERNKQCCQKNKQKE